MNPFSKIKSKINANLTKKKCVIGNSSSVLDHNSLISHDRDKNSIILGENTHIEGQLMTFPGGKIKIGNFCYLAQGSKIWSDTLIEIKDRTIIAHNVNIFDNQTHPLDPVARHQQFVHIIQKGFPKDLNLNGKPVIIEEDVWIACNSIILRGVTIGKCSIIGAGSVVTKDVPAWTIVAGNPAQIIGKVPEGERKILNSKEVVSDRG
ncbi:MULTISPECIES: acetyltransferase [unclassified Coleofasciculus]|uniref:acyltransferase n=1 Tax=Cyanophyceae TaxID=3028117 RepID=UPI001686E87C|nr:MULTISPECIES: acetyltransferase [unclassified Coleofasciculus]MBD1840582.1 acetyltransferase [Coleofasciculus sp. FACHB-501]MBD1895363.1 acetyltransferase [Coleofasciculus sp. FACHB-129]MBD2087798.1 acetyltransferase [Coleofasciculus sp. FACHB-542]